MGAEVYMNLWGLRVTGEDPLAETSNVELSLVGVIGIEGKDHNCEKLELIVFIYLGLLRSFPQSTIMNHDSLDGIKRLDLTDIISERASHKSSTITHWSSHSLYVA